MAYLVLARKYRPQTFQDVVKQDHVTRTLANAIEAGRVAHAILFSGPRGTGKTTVARILAKAMNCEKGPTADVCNKCRSCTEITKGSAVDVFEIDGASNNSVDQIRELRDNIRYMPAHSRLKIYIIDEVHMLSISAFNALLKTLEEPPAHVMFIFATTEVHKIPITILSRCQRHDFRRIDLASIASHMKKLCTLENFELSNDHLSLIARESGGSMRDALSLLDQILSCGDMGISHDALMDMLGVIDRKVVFGISKAVLTGDMASVLESINEVYTRGHDLKKLYSDLLEQFRHLMIVKIGKSVPELVDLPHHEIDEMRRQVSDVSPAFLNQIFEILFKAEPAIRFSSSPKMALEMAFIKIDQTQPALTIDMLVDGLDKLKEAAGSLPSGTAARGRQKNRIPDTPIGRQEDGDVSSGLSEQDYKQKAGMQNVEPGAPEGGLPGIWRKITDLVSEKKPSLAAHLMKCRLVAITDSNLDVEVTGNGYTLNAVNRSLDVLEKVCLDYFDRKVELNVIEKIKTDSELRKKKAREKEEKNKALSHQLVADAVEIFNGKIEDVKIIQED